MIIVGARVIIVGARAAARRPRCCSHGAVDEATAAYDQERTYFDLVADASRCAPATKEQLEALKAANAHYARNPFTTHMDPHRAAGASAQKM